MHLKSTVMMEMFVYEEPQRHEDTKKAGINDRWCRLSLCLRVFVVPHIRDRIYENCTQLTEISATPRHTSNTPAQRSGATSSCSRNFAPSAPATQLSAVA